jgi:quercetin dioxygenase-like cupin family protein
MRATSAIVVVFASAISCASNSVAPEAAVPVENEPHHVTVLKNDYLQVFHVTLEPGETSLLHTHAHDDAAVRLSTATVASEGPGEPMGQGEPVRPGQVSARTCEPTPVTHRVHNIGTTRFVVMDVQILKRPEGPPSSPIKPPAAENSQIRVYHYELSPGAVSAPHTHTRPYLLVAVTDVSLLVSTADGHSLTVPLCAGEFRWVEAADAHAFCSDGNTNGIVVEFELK